MVGLSSAEYIKALMIDYLLKDNQNILIGNEIMYGIEQRMVDLIMLETHITAIEIKAQNDSFRRLPEQLGEYQKIFSYIYLVVTANHLAKALSMVSQDIGLYLVDENEEIKLVRKAKLQRKASKQDLLATISASFLKKRYPAYKKYDADKLRLVLSRQKTSVIRSLLYDFLEDRITPRFNAFLLERGLCTHVDDIFLLSFPSKTII